LIAKNDKVLIISGFGLLETTSSHQNHPDFPSSRADTQAGFFFAALSAAQQ
jgi:hypothetical protein